MRQIIIALAAFAVPAALCTSASADEAAEKAFAAKCASCHGKDGKGKTKQGEKMKIADMTAPAWQKEFTTEKIKKTILEGVKRDKDGVKQEMKPFQGKIAPELADALAAYVKGLK